MTNAPSTRQTHVIRIAGTNKNGDVLQDIWADVERIDIQKSVTQTLDNNWQGHQRKHLWMDDPDADNYIDDNGNPARVTEIVKVCSPDETNIDDPELWIPIRVIKSMKSTGVSNNITGLGTQSGFHTGMDDIDPTITTRVVEVRKIVHYDTTIDDAAQAAFDADPTRTAYVVPGDQYFKIDGVTYSTGTGTGTTKDDSQFVNHEIITYLKHRFNEVDVNVGLQTKLLNQYLIDESDAPDYGTVVGATGINPPYRLDPWQNIINVKLTPLYLYVRLYAGNTAYGTGPSKVPTMSPPAANATKNQDQGSVRFIDTWGGPGRERDEQERDISWESPITSFNGFSNCFQYTPLQTGVIHWDTSVFPYAPIFGEIGWLSALSAWTFFSQGNSSFDSILYARTGQSCPLINSTFIQADDGTNLYYGYNTSVPVQYASSKTFWQDYLFAIPVGDDLVDLDVHNLIAPSITGALFDQAFVSGTAKISLSVYSRLRGQSITKLSQLIQYGDDTSPKPDPDDSCILYIATKADQGKFKVNVHLDPNENDVQIDNYGKTFRPYKVTIDPSKGSLDDIPQQPPPQLPPP